MNTKLDALGIGLSGLCLVHCLATPALVLLAPALAASVLESELIHLALLAIAIPLSSVAFVRGLNRHKCRHPGVLGLIGLVVLGIGLAIPTHETLLTVCGALVLAIGHVFNQRLLTAAPA